MSTERTPPSPLAIDPLGLAVDRVMAAAPLAMAVADHVRDYACKLDCFDAIELHLMRPAAGELQDAYEAERHLLQGT